ncbi:glycosyltransferase [Mycetocola sp. 2940]|uniref:glycosyltransferase n=1 Tax=Mycetocola sp. 2940 TaxID=3156452 RepID=UPI0033978129
MPAAIRVMQSFGVPRPTTNPYISMLARELSSTPGITHLPFSWKEALRGSYDVFHVHWPDALLAARNPGTRLGKRLAFAALLLRLRLRGTAVVQTVHNVTAAEGRALDRALIGHLEDLVSLRIRINPATEVPPDVPSELIAHGHYRDWFGPMPRRRQVAGRIGYVGLIKAYKGADDLVAAFLEAHRAEPALSLVVAGQPRDEAIAQKLRGLALADPDISLELSYVRDERLTEIITESEIVVLPYRRMHNSGAALAALSLDRPVLVPRTPANEALAREVGAGWVHFFDGALSSEALLEAVHTVRERSAGPRPRLDLRDWDQTGADHLRAYQHALHLSICRSLEMA